MSSTVRLATAVVFLISGGVGIAQSASFSKANVSNVEPAIYSMSDLYRHADKVAVVKVLSGDTEAYEMPIYKGKVVTAFKGLSAGDTIYFGPYLGTELGSEYVLFLRDVPDTFQPKKAGSGYGAVRYSMVFDEGYSSMRTSYECGFNGAAETCDYAVRICTDYIKAPQLLETVPPQGTDVPFGCRWARRQQFLSVLDEIAHPLH